jgi:hypothetical protein
VFLSFSCRENRYWDTELWTFLFTVLLNCSFTDSSSSSAVDDTTGDAYRQDAEHVRGRRARSRQPVVGNLLTEVSAKLAEYLDRSGGGSHAAAAAQRQRLVSE